MNKGVTVRPLDAADDESYSAFYRVRTEAVSYGRDYPAVDGPRSLRVHLLQPTRSERWEAWTAGCDGRTVGTAWVVWPMADNRHVGWFGIEVDARHRRRGVGTALLRTLTSAATGLGRRCLQGEVARPYAATAEPVPGIAFSQAHGFERALSEAHQVLRLPVADEVLQALADSATQRHRGYRILTWTDHCPAEWVEDYCRLLGDFSELAPSGELDLEREQWDQTRLRETEQRRVEQDRAGFYSVAVAPDGRLVGVTELFVPRDEERDAHQAITVVLPAHRGHRLGVALKVANLRAMQAAHPDRTLVHTYNSEANTPMMAVNRALGFTPVEYLDEWQLRLPGSP